MQRRDWHIRGVYPRGLIEALANPDLLTYILTHPRGLPPRPH